MSMLRLDSMTGHEHVYMMSSMCSHNLQDSSTCWEELPPHAGTMLWQFNHFLLPRNAQSYLPTMQLPISCKTCNFCLHPLCSYWFQISWWHQMNPAYGSTDSRPWRSTQITQGVKGRKKVCFDFWSRAVLYSHHTQEFNKPRQSFWKNCYVIKL